MKALFSLLLLLGICFSEAAAQKSTAEDVLLKQVNNENNYIRQEAVATQQNQAIKQQIGSNSATLSQQGARNNVVVQQLGASNSLNLTQQGNGNSYEGYFIGNNNQSNVLQDGNNNRLKQEIITDNQKSQLSQLGDNNELIQIENRATAVPIQIMQKGDGMKVTIENGIIHN